MTPPAERPGAESRRDFPRPDLTIGAARCPQGGPEPRPATEATDSARVSFFRRDKKELRSSAIRRQIKKRFRRLLRPSARQEAAALARYNSRHRSPSIPLPAQ